MVTLDAHCQGIMQQYYERRPDYEALGMEVFDLLRNELKRQGIYVTAVEHRVKTEKSLTGKLELKGSKYNSLDDITDILGLRVVAFYTADVDKVAVMVKQLFDVDWGNSVDKRKLHELNSFGYNSLHYICRVKNAPKGRDMWFEVQMCTALQHVWSTITHDSDYKSDVQIPPDILRQFGRLAGMLELIDDEFSRLRTTLNDYRRHVQKLVASGQLNEVPLTLDTFRSYLQMKPFERLNRRIASVNQAELFEVSLLPFLPVLQWMEMKSLGDIERLIADNRHDAYQLAVLQLAVTDIDILAESVALQNLCIVSLLKNGGGRPALVHFFDLVNGTHDSNGELADRILMLTDKLSFMNKKQELKQ